MSEALFWIAVVLVAGLIWVLKPGGT